MGVPLGISLERDDAYRGAYRDAYKDLRLFLNIFVWMLIEIPYCL